MLKHHSTICNVDNNCGNLTGCFKKHLTVSVNYCFLSSTYITRSTHSAKECLALVSLSLSTRRSLGLSTPASDSLSLSTLPSAMHDHQQTHERVAALLCIMRAASDLYQTLLSKTNCIPKA